MQRSVTVDYMYDDNECDLFDKLKEVLASIGVEVEMVDPDPPDLESLTMEFTNTLVEDNQQIEPVG